MILVMCFNKIFDGFNRLMELLILIINFVVGIIVIIIIKVFLNFC